MFLWTRPLGLRTFRNTPEKAEATRVLAANQGLYNGFLAAGLLYGAITGAHAFVLFFLLCVVAAGLYGAYSVNKRIPCAGCVQDLQCGESGCTTR